MNWLTIISIFVLTIKGNLISIRKVFLFKKDFWKTGFGQSKTDNENLMRVLISTKSENDSSFKVCYSIFDGYCLKFNDQTYTVVKFNIENYITSFSNDFETHKNFLKIQYLFRVFPSENNSNYNDSISSDEFVYYNNEENEYIEKIYLTYKLLQKKPECDGDSISLMNNEIELRMFNIMEMFIKFIHVKLLRVGEYLKQLNEQGLNKKIEGCKIFDLFHFKDFSQCLENLKNFANKFNCFDLKNDCNSDSSFEIDNDKEKNINTSLEVSEFLDYMNRKFYEDHKELKGNNHSQNNDQKNFKLMFEKYRDHTKERLILHNLMLPIAGKYTIEYYLEEIYNFIHEFIEKNQNYFYFPGLRMYTFIFVRIIRFLDLNLLKLQKKAAKNFFRDGHFFKIFFNLPQMDVTLDDAINVENEICDYYNMMVYIIGLDLISGDDNDVFCFLNPIFIDDNDYKIVDGLEIELEFQNILELVVALRDNENNLTLEKNVHYFMDKFGKIYIPSEIVKMLNIQDLEINFYHKKFNKVFKVVRYFKI